MKAMRKRSVEIRRPRRVAEELAGCVAVLSAALAASNATLFGLNAIAVRRAARRRALSCPYSLAEIEAEVPRCET